MDRDPVQIRVAVHDALDDANHIVHIDVGQARRRAVALEHGAQPANDFAGALGDLADVVQRAAHLLEIGLGCVEQTHADVGVGEDRGEWLLNSCVRVAVSSPSVATRATCSSSARFCAAAASACLRAVTSIETPNSFGPVPSSGPTPRPRP